MKDLYLGELARFRNAALIAGALHVLALVFINQLCDPLQLRGEFTLAILVLYMLLAAGFGLYQFGSYRQSGRWVWLLHRPLPRTRIFGAIALASATLLADVLVLPVLFMVAASSATARVVDLRHFLQPLELLLFCLIAWLVGVCIVLSRSRTAFVIAALPFLLLFQPASGPALLLPSLLCLVLLAASAFVHFKPDRLAPPTSHGALLLVALPLWVSFYFVLLWAGSIGFQSTQILLGVHPLNRDVAPAGGYTQAIRAKGSELMGLGLASSTLPQAALWRREAALREPLTLGPDLTRYPVRQALINQDDSGWDDDNLTWTFSHDTMNYVGRDRITGRRRSGTIGPLGGFEAPPVLRHAARAGMLLATPHHLYGYDPDSGLRELIALPSQEQLASFPVMDGARGWLITNRHLLSFDTSASAGPWKLRRGLPLPQGFADLAQVDVLPLLDGDLVSFLYGRRMIDGVPGAQQIVQFANGRQVIDAARRPLAHDFPLLFEHKDWWFSPPLHALVALPSKLLSDGGVPDPARQLPWFARPRPAVAWAAAILNLLLAAAGSWRWLRATKLPAGRRLFWLVSCALLGLPALCTLAVLQPRASPPRRSVAAPGQTPAPA